ncbi:MAG: DUF1501 domain-containing protein [Pseudomonadota bacterium]
MNRRDALKSALAAGMLYSGGFVPSLSRIANAMDFPAISNRVLVNLMLNGGPDMRHILPPAFDPNPNSFGYNYWRAKADAHRLSDQPSSWQQAWDNEFFQVADGGTTFGIHNTLGWLKNQWDAGNVAIVNNAVGGRTRDHAHCIDIVNQGDREFTPNQAYASGWGGRLAAAAQGNVMALTRAPTSFCFGPSATGGFDNTRMIAASDMRDMTLFDGVTNDPMDDSTRISRGLKSYYAAKRQALGNDAVFDRFLETERKLREFGEPIDARLETIPIPPAIEAMTQLGGLTNLDFGVQLRNLHDAFACFDILGMRVASIDYGGWDTHERQGGRIEPQMEDIFGLGKGLDVLYQHLPQDALDNMVLVIAGEFGRQLRANGDSGTDHGEGNSVLVIGNSVNGGVYGEMFPDEEMSRLADPSPQIIGRTAMDHIFAGCCDWVEPNTGGTVFTGLATAELETGVNLSGLFA